MPVAGMEDVTLLDPRRYEVDVQDALGRAEQAAQNVRETKPDSVHMKTAVLEMLQRCTRLSGLIEKMLRGDKGILHQMLTDSEGEIIGRFEELLTGIALGDVRDSRADQYLEAVGKLSKLVREVAARNAAGDEVPEEWPKTPVRQPAPTQHAPQQPALETNEKGRGSDPLLAGEHSDIEDLYAALKEEPGAEQEIITISIGNKSYPFPLDLAKKLSWWDFFESARLRALARGTLGREEDLFDLNHEGARITEETWEELKEEALCAGFVITGTTRARSAPGSEGTWKITAIISAALAATLVAVILVALRDGRSIAQRLDYKIEYSPLDPASLKKQVSDYLKGNGDDAPGIRDAPGVRVRVKVDRIGDQDPADAEEFRQQREITLGNIREQETSEDMRALREATRASSVGAELGERLRTVVEECAVLYIYRQEQVRYHGEAKHRVPEILFKPFAQSDVQMAKGQLQFLAETPELGPKGLEEKLATFAARFGPNHVVGNSLAFVLAGTVGRRNKRRGPVRVVDELRQAAIFQTPEAGDNIFEILLPQEKDSSSQGVFVLPAAALLAAAFLLRLTAGQVGGRRAGGAGRRGPRVPPRGGAVEIEC